MSRNSTRGLVIAGAMLVAMSTAWFFWVRSGAFPRAEALPQPAKPLEHPKPVGPVAPVAKPAEPARMEAAQASAAGVTAPVGIFSETTTALPCPPGEPRAG